MFPLHQGDELCSQISFDPRQQDNIQQDLILAHAALYGTDMAKDVGKGRQPKKNSISMVNDGMGGGDNDRDNKKKKMHRDTERLRRQEMATLYSSLRSLLPLELIKGKRSMSDHTNEAVKYIKHQQENIRELVAKRDKLKNKSNFSALASEIGTTSANDCSSSSVMVRPCIGGIEIVFSSGIREKSLTLSRVLQVLLEEGISVANCVSTKVDQRLFHTVQAEVNDPTCLDLSALKQKLISLAPLSSRSSGN